MKLVTRPRAVLLAKGVDTAGTVVPCKPVFGLHGIEDSPATFHKFTALHNSKTKLPACIAYGQPVK
jgi:hypothetical protein